MGIVIGAFICLIIFTILSQFVWNISVVGNDKLETDFILNAFEDYGIKIGTRVTKEQMKEASEKAVIDIAELSWATINQKGTVLVIEVREKVDVPEMYDNSKPTNVIAKEDGVILSPGESAWEFPHPGKARPPAASPIRPDSACTPRCS